MFRKAFVYIGLVATGALVSSSAAKLEAPSIVREHTPALITHPEGATVQAIFVDRTTNEWAYLPEEHFGRRETETFFSAPRGQYMVTTGGSKIIKVIPSGNSGPGPKPDPPKPRPTPPDDEDRSDGGDQDDSAPPVPKPEKLMVKWVVWVHEMDDQIDHFAELDVWSSPTARQTLTDRNISITVYDDDQPEAQAFVAKAKGQNPAMFFVESNDRFLVFPAPKTVEELETLIRTHAIR